MHLIDCGYDSVLAVYLFIRYKKDQDIAFVATCSLHHLLYASLLTETGPPLFEFEVRPVHPLVCQLFYLICK